MPRPAAPPPLAPHLTFAVHAHIRVPPPDFIHQEFKEKLHLKGGAGADGVTRAASINLGQLSRLAAGELGTGCRRCSVAAAAPAAAAAAAAAAPAAVTPVCLFHNSRCLQVTPPSERCPPAPEAAARGWRRSKALHLKRTRQGRVPSGGSRQAQRARCAGPLAALRCVRCLP